MDFAKARETGIRGTTEVPAQYLFRILRWKGVAKRQTRAMSIEAIAT
jgi:hypothetical protein